ncbi:Crp/Fnr family transcriptional regulator [Kaistia nematophila]|uniref:Cyclic nucleotide-binding domain-containing protein n=1 Tax=Kaistia nematophila TaxID=2994654 RepID=A0A9X3IMA6_9HYPH|nr:cyclic nucleotide-binding domain-containing protein [Kaistia nematophila]
MFDILETFGGWYDLPAHIGYLLFAVSMFLTNIFWLRILLIVSLAFQIVYFTMAGGALYTGIGWNIVFILINAYRLVSLMQARRRLGKATGGHLLGAGADEVVIDAANSLDDTQIEELIRLGEVYDLAPGAPLTTEGEPVDWFYLVTAGHAVVMVDDAEVARIHPGEFVGEISFLTGIAATATVRASERLTVIALDREKLARACAEDARLSAAVHQVIGNALARKLVVANQRRATKTPQPA